MRYLRTRFDLVSSVAVVATLAACASTEPSDTLQQAQAAVQAAARDATVAETASVELDRARQSLQRAEALQDESGGRDRERIEHSAYLAKRYAEIAMTQADAARAENEIDTAEAERNRVLLDVRTSEARRRAAEAERAQALAERRAQQVQSAREEALDAQDRAHSLEEQLAELQARETERGLVLTLSDVLFDTDEAELKPGAARAIDRLTTFLQEYPERELLIEGHTDSRGTEEYNEMLSTRRANAVRDALAQRGIDIARLQTRGLGERAPVATNETASGRQENRRVEIVISDANGRLGGIASI